MCNLFGDHRTPGFIKRDLFAMQTYFSYGMSIKVVEQNIHENLSLLQKRHG